MVSKGRAIGFRRGPSELRSAIRMREIGRGGRPLTQESYTLIEVADRYDLHPQSVYDGVKAGHVLYPKAVALGTGERPRLAVSREALLACDRDRLTFYRTTPSWRRLSGMGAPAAPARRSAAVVIAERRLLDAEQ